MKAAAPPQALIDEFVGAAHGDFGRVQALLAEHPALLNARAAWDETALGAAAQTGRRDIAEFLLAAGAPLDLCASAMLGHAEEVASFLVTDPALANGLGAHGLPALYHAAIAGHLNIAEMLLSQGADVNLGRGASTALHGAVAFSQLDMARWLLDQGADPAATDYENKTPLDRALEQGHTALADLLRQHAAPN